MNTLTMPKFCKDCAHFFTTTKSTAKCQAPDAVKIDLVFGLLSTDCYEARLDIGACGSDGRLFTPLTVRIDEVEMPSC